MKFVSDIKYCPKCGRPMHFTNIGTSFYWVCFVCMVKDDEA